MTIKRILQTASMMGVALAALNASASPITFTTNATGTGFNGGTANTLNSTAGASATLSYVDQGLSTVGVPSNVNFGNFTLVCASCTTQSLGGGAVFNPFTFKVIITDVTDTATGFFLGTSSGGTIFANLSSIDIAWSPLQLGPGTTGATTGNFGSTFFQITSQTRIVAPNSGAEVGSTTVQGNLGATPEPATFGLLGGALVAIGMFRRKKLSRRSASLT